MTNENKTNHRVGENRPNIGGLLRSFDLSIWSLIIANMVPLLGVLAFDWHVGSILVVYWAENLVVGFYGILRIIFCRVKNHVDHASKLFLVPFFLIHFGGFCAIHGSFIMMFVKMSGSNEMSPDIFPDSDVWWGFLIFVGLLVNVIKSIWLSFGNQILWPVFGLVISHGISFVQNFLYRGEFRDRDPRTLMLAPYGRMVVMHVAIIAAGLPVMLLGSPLPLLMILVVFKTVADVLLHIASHKLGKSSTLMYLQRILMRRIRNSKKRS